MLGALNLHMLALSKADSWPIGTVSPIPVWLQSCPYGHLFPHSWGSCLSFSTGFRGFPHFLCHQLTEALMVQQPATQVLTGPS